MDNYFASLYESYFNALKHLGYVNAKIVNKLIVASFVKDILDGEFSGCLTEDNTKELYEVLTNLYGTDCLFSIPNNCGIDNYSNSLTSSLGI